MKDNEVSVSLRPVESNDLPVLFEFQRDEEANNLAATHPRSADDFYAHWHRILSDSTVTVRTILANSQVIGSISCFPFGDQDFIGYWIGREFWGRGIATRALMQLLIEVPVRPLTARVAEKNIASVRVLQKNGFVIVGRQHSPGDKRFQECEEVILELSAQQ